MRLKIIKLRNIECSNKFSLIFIILTEHSALLIIIDVHVQIINIESYKHSSFF